MPESSEKAQKQPLGNPNFYSDQNPSKLAQELDEACDAKLTLRIPQSWKEKLASIPNSDIREHLKLLIVSEEE